LQEASGDGKNGPGLGNVKERSGGKTRFHLGGATPQKLKVWQSGGRKTSNEIGFHEDLRERGTYISTDTMLLVIRKKIDRSKSILSEKDTSQKVVG